MHPEFCSLSDLFKAKNVKKLTIQESQSLEGSNALKQMKNDKCPGVGGFPAEFFKFFWKQLKHFILTALNYAFDIGELYICFLTVVKTLLAALNTLEIYGTISGLIIDKVKTRLVWLEKKHSKEKIPSS